MSDFIDQKDRQRFERQENGHIVFARYRREDSLLYIDYVEAPQELRGTGAAGRLMEDIVRFAGARKLEIVPVCGYAAAWLKRRKQ